MTENAELVRAQLDRIVASKTFRQAKRLCALLEFAVEETLQGRANLITAPTVALEIFSNGRDIDERSEGLVRVQARQLRMKLSSYYEGEGRNDPLRISMPQGGYAASFQKPNSIQVDKPTSDIVDCIEIGIAPFTYHGDDPHELELIATIQGYVATSLSRFANVRVIRLDQAELFSATSSAPRVPELILTGHFVREKAGAILTVDLVSKKTQGIVWSFRSRQERSHGSCDEWRRKAASQIAVNIGSQSGVVATHLLDIWAQEKAAVDPVTILSLELARYRVRPTTKEHLRLREAFEKIIQNGSAKPIAWSALAYLYVEEHRFFLNPKTDNTSALKRAMTTVQVAIGREPSLAEHWAVLSMVYFELRELERAESAARKALERNPDNTDAMIVLSHYLWNSGETKEGLALTETALSLQENPPSWYNFARVHDLILNGDYEAANHENAKIEMHNWFWCLVLDATIQGHLGREPAFRAAWSKLEETAQWFIELLKSDRPGWVFPEGFVEKILAGIEKGKQLSNKPSATITDVREHRAKAMLK